MLIFRLESLKCFNQQPGLPGPVQHRAITLSFYASPMTYAPTAFPSAQVGHCAGEVVANKLYWTVMFCTGCPVRADERFMLFHSKQGQDGEMEADEVVSQH